MPFSLTPEAQDEARDLVKRWDNHDIPQVFSFAEAGSDDGTSDNEALDDGFRIPSRFILTELNENGLLRLEKQRHSWRVTLLQPLRQAVENEFNERKPVGIYFTPPALVKLMVEQVKPELDETIYDPTCGIGSLLLGAYRYVQEHHRLNMAERKTLHEQTFYGREIDFQTFRHAQENLGNNSINPSNLWYGNTLLKETYNDSLPKHFDLILANPPFSSNAKPEEREGFEFPSRYAELLFLQHIMDSLKPNGRCAVVLPEGVISRTDREFREVKQKLLSKYDVQKIIRLDDLTAPYDTHVKFNVIIFRKGESTQKVIYSFPGQQPLVIDRSQIEQRNYDLTPAGDTPIFKEDSNLNAEETKKDSLQYHVFISYRRDDTAWQTGRLYDYLKAQLDRSVFMDFDSIPIGQKFDLKIEDALSTCNVFLAIIGQRWLQTDEKDGRQRIHEEGDWVRREIRAAINREIMIIPILVDNASMPHTSDLPEDIRELTRYNALEITPKNFHQEIEKLVQTLKATLYTGD